LYFNAKESWWASFNSKLHCMGCKILSGEVQLFIMSDEGKYKHFVLLFRGISAVSEIQGCTMAKFPQT